MTVLFSDNALTTLASTIGSTDTQLVVLNGAGAGFPILQGTDKHYAILTLEDASGNRELIRVNYRSGDVLGSGTYPLQRGYGGTVARAWAAGASVDVRLCRVALLESEINEQPPVTIASAASVAIGTASTTNISVVGTTTIVAFDSAAAGVVRRLTFASALTITYNTSSMILPGAQNLSVQAGDTVTFRATTTGWECIGIHRANGQVSVSSNAVCANLNADLLDGYHASSFAQTSSVTRNAICNVFTYNSVPTSPVQLVNQSIVCGSLGILKVNAGAIGDISGSDAGNGLMYMGLRIYDTVALANAASADFDALKSGATPGWVRNAMVGGLMYLSGVPGRTYQVQVYAWKGSAAPGNTYNIVNGWVQGESY